MALYPIGCRGTTFRKDREEVRSGKPKKKRRGKESSYLRWLLAHYKLLNRGKHRLHISIAQGDKGGGRHKKKRANRWGRDL